MAVTGKDLRAMPDERHMGVAELRKKPGTASNTMAKLYRNEPVMLADLD